MNPVFDPLQRKMVSGPEAGQNTEVDGFEVSFIGASTSGVYNAGSGLTLSGNVFAADVADVGFGMELNGGTASYARYRAIENVMGGTVTLMAGHAYKAYATISPLTITAETIPANMWGQEGHLEVYLANASYVVVDTTKVVLTEALEPDSVNNLTIRFHDGYAIISVEDHIAGYIVVSATGTAAGSLPYGLTSATQDYVAFDATTNGATIDLSGAIASGEKHIVGNGRTETVLSGSFTGTNKTTFANLTYIGSVVANGATEFADGLYHVDTVTGSAGLTIGSGAIIDLTGNTNATPIAPGGGITFEQGGATVYPYAGSSSSILVGGFSKIASISSDGALTGITGSSFVLATSAVASNAEFSGANAAFTKTPSVGMFTDCTFAKVVGNGNVTWTVIYSGTMKFRERQSFLTGASKTIIITNGTILDFSGIPISGAAYVAADSIIVEGPITLKNRLGNDIPITGGTYTSFNDDGTTVPPQPE